MHNFKNKVGYFYLIFLVVCGFIVPINVEAKQTATGSNALANEACSKAIFGGTMLSVSNDSLNGYVKVNAKNGVFNVKWYIGDADTIDYSSIFGEDPIEPLGSVQYVGGTGDYLITIPKTMNSQKVIVIAEAVGDSKNRITNVKNELIKVEYKNKKKETKKTTCKSGTVGIDASNKLNISGTGAVVSKTIPAISSKELKAIEDNTLEATECLAMRSGKFKSDATPSDFDLTGTDLAAYNAQMQKSFPVCYGISYNSSFEYSAASIRKIRQSSLKAFKEYLKFGNAKSNNKKYEQAEREIKEQNFKKVTYDKKNNRTAIDNLFCDKKTTTDTTEKYYTRTTEADNDVCKVTCQEQIQITYGPPVATKAGLCFQYKVTVRSKVTCKTQQNININWPTLPDSCGYTPICEGNEEEVQAGPSRDFDICINKCDGGKYSQSCINSCYNEVYKNKNKLKKSQDNQIGNMANNNNNNNVIRRLSKSGKDPYLADSKCNTNEEIMKNADYCAGYFYKLKQQYPMGYYSATTNNSNSWIDYLWNPCFSSDNDKCKFIDDKNNVIKYNISKSTFVPGEVYVDAIKRSSPYYFRNKDVALSTIQSFYGVNSGLNGFGEKRTYIIDDGGIKRQKTNKFQCNETCGFIKDADSSSSCKNNGNEVADEYVKKFENIISELSKCSAKAECKDGESTFDINVDYNKNNKDENTKWNATNKSGISGDVNYQGNGDIKMFVPIKDGESIPKDLETTLNNGTNGTCYGRDNASYWQHYKTTITFPGTWIDLKTGRREYADPSEKQYFREKPNYYCVGYDYKPVNESWWDWRVNKVGDINKIIVDKNDNIKASIQSFGKYNWRVNVNCFYALSNKVTLVPSTNPPTENNCHGAECDTTIENIKMRPIDQKDIFAGRGPSNIGFNWTSAAKDNVAGHISGYDIDPGKYAERLEQEAKSNPSSLYSGSTEYSLHLTKDNIKNLRKYAKKNGYTEYAGNNKNKVEDVEGLYYYKSNILEDDLYTTRFDRKAKLGVNKGGVK